MKDVFHDWVRDFVDNRFDSLFLGREKLNVVSIGKLFSKQLQRLPINEDRLRR